ncbi:protein LphB [Legionella qingyii]|uniref:Protein LphB n=1 Tax=Legionella qingyii TaxID=2184757 RepID=A0A317U855_9GAMM|nr:protein LphB [Legionella qingyii]PWY57505.1 protein LphB [Legionella qingyii]RUR23311.1 protein LphB [Legionella qingyii]RUR26589.1 protein LphB [Legionella qingyii]
MKSGVRWYDSILILLFFYLFILQIQAIWPFTIDDMYISLRYAKHWAGGEGLLWNLHAPPVEGYSNFSFVALGALTLLLKGNPIVVLKIAGLFGLFFTCYFIYLISRFWLSVRESLLPCMGLLFYKGQIIWATSGLETTVYQSFICGAVYCCFRGMGYNLFPNVRAATRKPYFVSAGILLALAGMTRPEAPVFMILFFILMCWDRPKEKTEQYWYDILLFCLTLILFYGPYFFWRLIYFGYFFPNSVYCKGLTQSLTFSLDFHYLKLIWPLALLSLPACIKPQDKRYFFLWLPSLVYLIMLADSDPVVAFDNRLFLPAFALLLPLLVQGIRRIVFACRQKEDFTFALLFYLSFFVFLFLFIPAMSLADYQYFSQNPVKGEQLRGKVVDWLHSHGSPKDWVVLADSGLIPYASPLNFIDSYCLNNLSMAHYPTKQMYEQFCKEVLHKKPAFIILTSLIDQGRVIYTPSDVCLKAVLRNRHDYKLSNTYVSNNPDSMYRYEIYENSTFFSSEKK